ncbi:MAG: glycine betaine ABC transporter substrate-binding protein [Gaiellaceae bacterium]
MATSALAISVAFTCFPTGPGQSATHVQPTIVLGTKSFPQGLILGQLYKQVLEARGFTVVFKPRFASTKRIDAALTRGAITMYPEYTGVIVQDVFDRARSGKTARATYRTAKKLQRRRGFTLLEPAPFVDRAAIAILNTTADAREVDTLNDLGKIPNLRIGALPGFAERSTGVLGLRGSYQVPRVRVVSLRRSPYAALDARAVDAVVAFTTDPLPGKSSRHRLLKDPAHLFGPQNVAPVVPTKLVASLGPRFTGIVNAVSRKLTSSAVRTMNTAVFDGQSPETVARAFLVASGLVSAANVFVASNGSDAGPRCRRFDTPIPNPDLSGASLCKTFDRAYHLARPGDTVEVQTGGYEAQALSPKQAAVAPSVIIEPVLGGSVTVDDLALDGDHVTIRSMTISTGTNHGRGLESTASHVTLDGVRITGPYARVAIGGGGRNVTWKNGSLGTPGNTTSRVCGIDGGPLMDPQPVELGAVAALTFSNLDFYPFVPELANPACGPDGVMHMETIRVNDGVDGFRLERSRFHRGDGSGTARLFVTRLGGANSNNLTVVNNWFGAADGEGGGSHSVAIHPNQACVGYVFAYNQFEQGVDPGCSPMTSLELVGNTGVGPSYLCTGTSHVRNLWTWSSRGSCGSDRWVIDANFSLAALRYAADGYHLQPRSPAIDAGDTARCVALTRGVDIDGQRRSGRCDAGPDEFRAP